MNEITLLLNGMNAGGRQPADKLVEHVYEELRRMAAAKLAQERKGHTLQPTALVNEAYLSLVDGDAAKKWENRRHFFCAAAEAMRRILVDSARRKTVRKRAALNERDAHVDAVSIPLDEVLAVHEVLDDLAAVDCDAFELVKLRFFAGISLEESAAILKIPQRTAERRWSFARGWLFQRLNKKV